jgi:hypothetical protein
MSNLLERAIIDAKALKDAALRNAEQLVVEKYQLEVKEAMDRILDTEDLETIEEQDVNPIDDLFGTGDSGPMDQDTSATPQSDDGMLSFEDLEAQLPDAFDTDEDQMIQIKLDSLDDELEDEDGLFGGDDKFDDDEIGIDIQDDEPNISDFDATPDVETSDADIGIDIGGDVSPAALEEMIADALGAALSEDEDIEEGSCSKRDEKKIDEDEELEEEVSEELDEEIDLDELMERVRVEGTPQKSGWAGTPESVMQEYESMLLALEQDSEVKEENEELRKNVSALQKENKTLSSVTVKLQEQNKEFRTAFKTLQKKLETMNVSNAKLLYINQALENASLNERQKRKIVEAISKAETVQEAKIVFETLNETVATTSDVKREATLNEMVSRKSSLLVAARKEQPKQEANPMFNRMQTLAGIKTN